MTLPAGTPALVVDDDNAIRHLVARILRRHQYNVDTATDGADAIAQLDQRTYDLVLLDLMMPRASGYEVLTHLEQSAPEVLPNTIVMTATHDVAALEQWPMCRIIRKPFDIKELLASIEACRR